MFVHLRMPGVSSETLTPEMLEMDLVAKQNNEYVLCHSSMILMFEAYCLLGCISVDTKFRRNLLPLSSKSLWTAEAGCSETLMAFINVSEEPSASNFRDSEKWRQEVSPKQRT